MSIVYVVTSGSYSDYGINGIFSTEELAKAYIAEAGSDYGIEEWDMDADVGVKRLQVWKSSVYVDDGSETPWHTYNSPHSCLEIPFRSRTEVRPDGHGWRGFIIGESTVSKEHSLKVAVEGRQALLREEA